jgi:hypothetical protein
MPHAGKGGRYHHGDLRSALIEVAIEIIAERGVRGFSVAEASHPEIEAAERPLAEALLECVRALTDGSDVLADNLATAVEAAARGFALLLLDGDFGAGNAGHHARRRPGRTGHQCPDRRPPPADRPRQRQLDPLAEHRPHRRCQLTGDVGDQNVLPAHNDVTPADHDVAHVGRRRGEHHGRQRREVRLARAG